MTKTFIFEILMMVICPIPYCDWYVTVAGKGFPVTYLFSDFVLALMWFRVYFVIRAIFNYSVYTDAYSKKLC